MKSHCCKIVVFIIFMAFACSFSQAATSAKMSPLDSVQKLRQDNHKKLNWVEARIRKTLRSLAPEDPKSLPKVESEIGQLRTLKSEYLLRQEFYDRISFMLESKYKGHDLKKFLLTNLLHLSEIELRQESQDTPLWKVYAYLHKAIADVPEQDENLIDFIESYVSFSGLSQPIRPEDFVESRNYTNGKKTEKGSPLNPEYVGEVVEKKLLLLEMFNSIYAVPSALPKTPTNPGTLDQPMKITIKTSLRTQLDKPDNLDSFEVVTPQSDSKDELDKKIPDSLKIRLYPSSTNK